MERYYNIRFRWPGLKGWGYMIAAGTLRDVLDDAEELRQLGFRVEVGKFLVKEVG